MSTNFATSSIADYHSQQRSYATRMSPQSLPDLPRKSKQAQNTPLPFPAPGVVLHPEDANSKVFLAIGRSLMSVDNRAMTIKDLSEMTQKFGLMCQNVSAASQAITTYIRQHLSRCELQQDLPLLLRHTLSGTRADDDLLPALYSRSGGSSCPVGEDRATNFRRGTTVWYLSRATGAPCPFARANIRLCDYAEQPAAGCSKDGKKPKDYQTNLKRKRPTRSCTTRDADDKSDCAADGPPPPKVKLTLKFQPLLGKATLKEVPTEPINSVIDLCDDSDSDSDSMSVDEMDGGEQPWSLPPYPRRSITIPCYTPTYDGLGSFFFNDPSRRLSPPRSPSLPLSIPSPPPDSDDDEEYFSLRHSLSEPESDFDADSPGPQSPSEQPELEVTVKEEPRVSEWPDDDTAVKVENTSLDLLTPLVKEEPLDFVLESDRDSSPYESSSYDLVTPSPHFAPRQFSEFFLRDLDLSDSHVFRPLDIEDELGLESGFPFTSAPSSKSSFSLGDKRQMSEPLETPSLATSLSFMLQDMSMKSPTEMVPPVPPVGLPIALPTQLSDPDLSSHTADSTQAIVSLLAGLDKSATATKSSSSMTEQELFQEFCCIPDEKQLEEAADAESQLIVVDDAPSPSPAPASTPKQAKAPVRRSKRVANAIAARTAPVRTRRSTRSTTA